MYISIIILQQFKLYWASLVVQLVKNPPAMQETWARSLGWEHSLKEGVAVFSSVLAWRISMNRGAWWAWT